ncbi:hypothetical protein [uncultured Thiodictyon sp.]|nr:hypothetical protein [uncultured Thiodictyon sp.]
MPSPEGCPQSATDDRVSAIYVDPQFRDLTTRVRGQPVETRLIEQ